MERDNTICHGHFKVVAYTSLSIKHFFATDQSFEMYFNRPFLRYPMASQTTDIRHIAVVVHYDITIKALEKLRSAANYLGDNHLVFSDFRHVIENLHACKTGFSGM